MNSVMFLKLGNALGEITLYFKHPVLCMFVLVVLQCGDNIKKLFIENV